MIKISKDYAGSVGAGVGSTTDAMLAIGAGSGDAVGLGVGNAGNIKDVKIAFEFSKDN